MDSSLSAYTLAYRQFAHDPKKYGCYRHLLVT
jgi:hypothetical protein